MKKLDDLPSETYSDAETTRRREDALKRMLNTPHQPHKAADGKPKTKQAKSQGPEKPKSA